jgi:hypothetical protein
MLYLQRNFFDTVFEIAVIDWEVLIDSKMQNYFIFKLTGRPPFWALTVIFPLVITPFQALLLERFKMSSNAL